MTNQGGGDYQVTGAPDLASGTYTVNGGTTSHNITGSATPLGGTIGIGSSDTLGTSALTLGNISVAGQTISLKADINYVGTPVPLPPSAWMMASGVGLLGLRALKRRRAVPDDMPHLGAA